MIRTFTKKSTAKIILNCEVLMLSPIIRNKAKIFPSPFLFNMVLEVLANRKRHNNYIDWEGRHNTPFFS